MSGRCLALPLAAWTLLVAAMPDQARAQNGSVRIPESLEAGAAPPERPFRPGERLTYRVKLGIVSVGEGHMTVHGVEDIRGRDTYHVSMDIEGSALFGTVKVRDYYHSWFDVRDFASRHYVRDINEPGYSSYREYAIYPEERRWERTDPGQDKSGVSLSDLPLDDIAFVYWIRTLPLEVGETYTFDRYFKEDGNPVILKVLRRETKEVDAGTFETIVVQPIIKTSGLFSQDGEAELYFSDDEHRRLIYMRVDIPVMQSITLQLKRVEEGWSPPEPAAGG